MLDWLSAPDGDTKLLGAIPPLEQQGSSVAHDPESGPAARDSGGGQGRVV